MSDEKEQRKICQAVLEYYPVSQSEGLGLKLETGDPDDLFAWLCASLLMSTRISVDIAMNAARAILANGWGNPWAMADSSWDQRQKALEKTGYSHYKDSTATRLTEAARLVNKKYDGDLNNLRKAGYGDVYEIHQLLTEFTGIGDIGADIFCREAQLGWEELYPFMGDKCRDFAKKMGLTPDAETLASYVGDKVFPRLCTGIVLAGLDGQAAEIRKQAA